MTLGNKINSLRTERELSQKELATLINVTTRTIAEWEADEVAPSLMELVRLSKALNVSSDALLETIDEETPSTVSAAVPQPTPVIVPDPITVPTPVMTPAPVAHKKKKNKKIALIVASIVLIVALVAVLFLTVFVPMQKYVKAEKLFAAGNYSQAYNIYVGLGNYWNSVEQSKECLYLQAVAYRNDKDWDAANSLFEQIKDYKDSATLIHYHHHTIIDSKKATCTDSGYFAYKCDCGDEYTKDIPAGHIYTSATCTEPRKCSNCGKTSGSALGHNTTAAKCSRCGKITFETITYSGTGHTILKDIKIPEGKFVITGYAKTLNDYMGDFDVCLYDEKGIRVAYWTAPIYVYYGDGSAQEMKSFNGGINGGRLVVDAGENIWWTITIEVF